MEKNMVYYHIACCEPTRDANPPLLFQLTPGDLWIARGDNHDHYVKKYNLTTDKKLNQAKLAESGYVFGDTLYSQILQGTFVRTEATGDASDQFISTSRKVDTHSHGIYLMHSVDELKRSIGLSAAKVKAILERLLRHGELPRRRGSCRQ